MQDAKFTMLVNRLWNCDEDPPSPCIKQSSGKLGNFPA